MRRATSFTTKLSCCATFLCTNRRAERSDELGGVNGRLELRQSGINERAPLLRARSKQTMEIAMSNLGLAALDLDRFLLDPASSFRRPEDVIDDPRLRRQQKIEI